jgi:ferritin
MLSKKMEAALNAQINAELWSAYLYLSMSAHFAANGYPGFANWFEVQFKEEQDHAMIFFKYINSRGGKVTLKQIDEVQTEWKSLLDAYENTLSHEQKVTGMINELYALALEEKDYATQSMLTWFIDEQVEEEESAQTLIDSLRMIKDNGFGLYTLDKELAARSYTVASPLTSSAD